MGWLSQSLEYENIVIPVLRQEGLPRELFILAMIESGFNNAALSKKKATGTWQFMKKTATHYGLTINHWVDERRDPIKSTLAAARYLRDLYKEFDDWFLSMAAYNAGQGRIKNAIKKAQTRDFWALSQTAYIKPETRHYVPKLLAALIIATNPKEHGFIITQKGNRPSLATVTVKRPVRLAEVASKLNLAETTLRELNPELIRHVTPPKVTNYALKIPGKYLEIFKAMEASFSNLKEGSSYTHLVMQGETLKQIAKHYGVSQKGILKINHGINQNPLRAGQKLEIPIPNLVISKTQETPPKPAKT
jgi:membrane-bound lytic murein transglycosylase D